jgi:hypothetical protein
MWEYFRKTMGTSWDRYGNGWRKVRAPVKKAKAVYINVLPWDCMSYFDHVGTIGDFHGI